MTASRRSGWMSPRMIGVALLGIGGASATLAAPTLELDWDRTNGSSQAIVRNSAGDVLAESTWDGALPSRYSADPEEIEVPILLLGWLRDQLEHATQPESDAALDMITGLMEDGAATPVSELSSSPGVWIAYSQVTIAESCGTLVNVFGECTQPAEPTLQNTVCQSSACKKTTLTPMP